MEAAAKQQAEAARKAAAAAATPDEGEKPPKPAPVEAAPTPAPTEEPVAAKDPPKPPAVNSGKASSYAAYAHKRDAIEAALVADPTLLEASKALQEAYGEYLKDSAEIQSKWQKEISKNANKALLYQHLRDAELFSKTGKQVDSIASMLKLRQKRPMAGEGPVIAETFSTRLVESRPMTSRVQHLVFERVDGQPFAFESGQWVSVVLPIDDAKGRPLRRSYSIASPPNGSPRFELVVTHVENGPGSTFLTQASVGTELDMKGPQGTFTRPASEVGPALLVATGTGIAPFRGMLHDAIARGQSAPLWVLFGVRGPNDLLFGEELHALARKTQNLRLEVTYSRPPVGWLGRVGYVQEHVRGLWSELNAAGGGEPHAYICGVKKMLTSVRSVLRDELGLVRQRVHLESYD